MARRFVNVDYSGLNRLSAMVNQAVEKRKRDALTQIEFAASQREAERQGARQAAIGEITSGLAGRFAAGVKEKRAIGSNKGDQFDMSVETTRPHTEQEREALLLPAFANLIGLGPEGVKTADVLENIYHKGRQGAMNPIVREVDRPEDGGITRHAVGMSQTGEKLFDTSLGPVFHPDSAGTAATKNLETLRQKAITGRTQVKQLETQYGKQAIDEAIKLVNEHQEYKSLLNQPENIQTLVMQGLDPVIGSKVKLARDYVSAQTNAESSLTALQGLGKAVDDEGRLIDYKSKPKPRTIDARSIFNP